MQLFLKIHSGIANSVDPDQTVHIHMLIWAFAIHIRLNSGLPLIKFA